MKIWSVTYNSDDGINTDVFTNEVKACRAAWDFLAFHWEDYLSIETMPDCYAEAQDRLSEEVGFIDSVHVTEHTISVGG